MLDIDVVDGAATRGRRVVGREDRDHNRFHWRRAGEHVGRVVEHRAVAKSPLIP